MNITLCTLFEGTYHFGVAALSNSLIASGYTGSLWVGYRGELPTWITEAEHYDAQTGHFQVAPTLRLCMVPLDTSLHFAYYKPTFMRDVFEKHAPDSDVVAYLDPDIVMKCSWANFSPWFSMDGISLVEDVNWSLPARHPKRLQWNAFFAEHQIFPRREVDRYYNSGFIALSRQNLAFLEVWQRFCSLVVDYNQGLKHIKAGNAEALFHSTDQDAMNFAITVYDAPLNTAGREAMDFAAGGYHLSHAIGSPKPWEAPHIRSALLGQSPSVATKAYYQYANGPIKVFSDGQLARKRLSMRIASVIGRFYGSR